jgi:hypothetical protein
MTRISELEARIAADTAELARRKAEMDWERYRPVLKVLIDGGLYLMTDNDRIERYLAARNHDPDVVALVQWARGLIGSEMMLFRRDAIIAPFAAIVGK